MRESRTSGSVRGAASNRRPYRDPDLSVTRSLTGRYREPLSRPRSSPALCCACPPAPAITTLPPCAATPPPWRWIWARQARIPSLAPDCSGFRRRRGLAESEIGGSGFRRFRPMPDDQPGLQKCGRRRTGEAHPGRAPCEAPGWVTLLADTLSFFRPAIVAVIFAISAKFVSGTRMIA